MRIFGQADCPFGHNQGAIANCDLWTMAGG